ncbi:hypothetical protein [Phormidesmis sp. 146-33]
MKKRQSNVQKFSTFLSFPDAGKSLTLTRWVTESALERSIEQQVQSYPEQTAEAWALHFLKILQNEKAQVGERPIAEKHLSAFLQEVCYQAAQKLQKQFQSVQYRYSLADLFQIGNLFVNQPAKLFRSFKLDHQSSLEGYAKTAIYRFIGNTIYTQDLEAKREKFSDYGLLKDLSRKELKEALASRGIETSQIDAYCFAVYCHSTVCQPQSRHNSRSLEAPSQEELVQIAACYNQKQDQLITLTELADANTIQAMLSTCIRSARDYRTNRVLTLESDEVVSDPMPTPLESAIQTEEREQVESLVSQLFTTIPETGQTLLKLWLGLNLTQAEIAIVLKRKHPELQKQYQVARHLGKYSRNILKEFLQQCQQLNPGLALQDDKAIETIQELLDECLQSHCKRLVHIYLDQFNQQYISRNVFLMFTHSVESKPGFLQVFESQLEHDLNLPSESLKFVSNKIAEVVSEWLQSTRL